MGINIRIHITLFLICILSSGAMSQNNLSVYNNYHETIWLSSSRHLFLSGENIDFNAKLIEQDTYLQSYLSKNIKVELLNSKGQAIKQQNLVLKNSTIAGVFVLPPESPSGWYYLRAYTNWMRNFDFSDYAVLAIKVFNTKENDPAYLRPNPGKIAVKLFPKGGSTGIYSGYDNKQGVEIHGKLVASSGDTICSFATHASGWSLLDTELELEDSYKVIIDCREASQYSQTAEVIREGLLDLIISDNGSYIQVITSGETSGKNKTATLILHQSYTSIWESEEINLDKAEFRIPKTVLPNGIFQFTLVAEDNTILSKRLWSEYNAETVNISLSDTSNYLDIKSNYSLDYNFPGDSAELSILIGMEEPNNPYINHLPGLKGWPCTSNIPNDHSAFKGWLLGNSYSNNNVYSILDEQDEVGNKMAYLPETRSGIIEGKIFDKSSGLTISDIGISLTVLNNNYFDACTTDENGQFYFSLPDQLGTSDYILNFTSQTDSGMQIFVNPDFEPSLNNTIEKFSLNEEELQYLKALNTNLQLNNIYGYIPEYKEKEIENYPDRVTFFHPPDQVIVVAEFIKLANIREVIYEVVPNVSVRNTDGQDYIRVNSVKNLSGDQEALVLLDGIPLANHSNLLNLSPDRIDKIEVKNRSYVYGRNIYSAIVNFVSPNKDYAGIDLPESSKLSTTNLPREGSLIKTIRGSKTPNIPILEPILFWEHQSSTSKSKVDFSTNDAVGNFQISISGFKKNGEWVHGSRNAKIGAHQDQ